MSDLLRYEDNLVACYEAEYILSVTPQERGGGDYPDASEVVMATYSSPPLHVREAGLQNAHSTSMEASLSPPLQPCFDRTNFLSSPTLDAEGTKRCQTRSGSVALGGVCLPVSSSRVDDMELDHSQCSWSVLQPANGSACPELDENACSVPQSVNEASPHDFQKKLSLLSGLTPVYTSPGTDALISHHDGPQRKKTRLRAPEY